MKNAVGKLITQAYHARAALARALHAAEVPPDERAERLRRDGIVVLDSLLPPDTWAKVRALNDHWFDRSRASEQAYSPDGKKLLEGGSATPAQLDAYYFLHIKHYHEKFDIYGLLDPLVRPILKAFYRSHYYYRDVECYRTQPPALKDEFEGSFAWHRDNYPPGCLKVIVYMTDVLEPENGPLVYAPGSHAGFKPELGGYGPRIPREEVEGKLELRPCLGAKGSVVIFDNNGVHRASRPAAGTREVLNTTVFPRVTEGRPQLVGLDLDAEEGFLKKYTR
jgi:hypothetical protein